MLIVANSREVLPLIYHFSRNFPRQGPRKTFLLMKSKIFGDYFGIFTMFMNEIFLTQALMEIFHHLKIDFLKNSLIIFFCFESFLEITVKKVDFIESLIGYFFEN